MKNNSNDHQSQKEVNLRQVLRHQDTWRSSNQVPPQSTQYEAQHYDVLANNFDLEEMKRYFFEGHKPSQNKRTNHDTRKTYNFLESQKQILIEKRNHVKHIHEVSATPEPAGSMFLYAQNPQLDNHITNCKLARIQNQENSFVSIHRMDSFDKSITYTDKFPLLNFRKFILYFLLKLKVTLFKVINHPIFELLSLLIIIANTILYVIDASRTYDENAVKLSDQWEFTFLVLFTTELAMKLYACTLWGKFAFYKSPWNILDTAIVVISWLSYSNVNNLQNYSFFRALRILRVYRILSTSKQLKLKLATFLQSMNYFLEVFLILFFFYSIFAIIGMKLFSGILQKKCVNPATIGSKEVLIGNYCFDDFVCPQNMICQKGFADPTMPLTNFDNFFNALFVSFQITLLEGWYSLMSNLVLAFPAYLSPLVYVYFVLVIFIGSVFILNLVKAIIIVQYNKSEKKLHDVQFKKRNYLLEMESFNLLQMKVCRYFDEIYFIKSREDPGMINNFRRAHTSNSLQQGSFREFDTSQNNSKELPTEEVCKLETNTIQSRSRLLSTQDYMINSSRRSKRQMLSQIKRTLTHISANDQSKIVRLKERPEEFHILYQNKRMSIDQPRRGLRGSSRSFQRTTEADINSAIKAHSDQLDDSALLSIKQKDKINKTAFRKLLNTWKKDKSKKVKVQISEDIRNDPYHCFSSKQDIFSIEDDNNRRKDVDLINETYSNNQSLKIRYSFDLLLYERVDKIINQSFSSSGQHVNFLKIENLVKKMKYKELQSVYSMSTPMQNISLSRRNFCRLFFTIRECSHDYYALRKTATRIDQPKDQSVKTKLADTRKQVKDHIIKSTLNKISVNKIAMARFFCCEFAVPPQKHKGERLIELSNYLVYTSIIDFDNSIVEKVSRVWSGFDVSIPRILFIEKIISEVEQVNTGNYDIWLKRFFGKLRSFRGLIRHLMATSEVDFLIITVVIFNSVILALYGSVSDDKEYILEEINFACTIFFIVEMVLKLVGLGLKYFRYASNWLDAIIVVVSIIDLFTDYGGSSSAAIRSLRLLRIFRVIKIIRILRYLRFVNVIMLVLSSSWSKLKYIFLIMLTFVVMFSLIGFGLFNKTLDQAYQGQHKALNFDNLYESVIFVFNILTTDNWDSGINTLLLGTQNRTVTLIYYFLFTFLGSIVVLNFFCAIILEGYSEPSTVDMIKELSKEEKSIVIIFKQKIHRINYLHGINEFANKTIQKFKSVDFKNFNLPFASKKSLLRNLVMHQNYQLDQLTDIDFNKEFEAGEIQNTMQSKKTSTQLEQSDSFPFSEKLCYRSLYIFKRKSRFRLAILRILKNLGFKLFIIAIVFSNCILLVALSYQSKMSKEVLTAVLILDYLSNSLLIVEFLMKIIAYGFALCKTAYIRNGWGFFDFVIVVLIACDMAILREDHGKSWLKIITLVRIFRLISHIDYFKRSLSNLYKAFSAIGNVLIIIVIYFLIYAILGVNFLRNKMDYCADGDGNVIYNKGKSNCLQAGLNWSTYDWNFNNVINALITLYVVSFLDNWQTIMLRAADSSSEATGAVYRANPYIFIYFSSFVLFVVFIIFNLGIGVIYVQYQIFEHEKRLNYNYLDPEENKWLYFMRMLLKTDPSYIRAHVLQSRLGRFFASVYNNRVFVYVIRCFILISVVILAFSYDGMSDTYQLAIEYIQMGINFCFMAEFAIKIYVQASLYFFNKWSVFEFSLILISIPDIILFALSDTNPEFKFAYQIYKITRILRIFRLFQITNIPFLEELDRIVKALIVTIPSILNILVIMLLLYFTYAIIAVTAFADAKIEEFNNFFMAFLNMFRFFTGESWSLVMWQLNKAYPFWGTLYFMSYIFITSYLLFNMFTLIMIDQFETLFLDPKSNLNTFNYYKNQFDTIWQIFSSKYGGAKIKEHDLFSFFVSLKAPLGFNSTGSKFDNINFYTTKNFSVEFMILNLRVDEATIVSKLSSFRIPVDAEKFVSYHFVFFYALKLSFNYSILGDEMVSPNLIIKKSEKQTIREISNMRMNKAKRGVKNYCSPLIKKVFFEVFLQTWAGKAANFEEQPSNLSNN